MAKVYHSEIFGLREKKYDWLNKHLITNVKWKRLNLMGDFYLFLPQDSSSRKEYLSYKRIDEIFVLNSSGVKTHRDEFVIDYSGDELTRRFMLLRNNKSDDEIIKRQFNLKDNRDWSFSVSRKMLTSDEKWKDKIISIQYRPFDFRKIFYADYMIDWPRYEVMRNMLEKNICLTIGRQGQVVGKTTWNLSFISESIIDTNLYYRGGAVSCPLYIYPEKKEHKTSSIAQMMMFEPAVSYSTRQPNIYPEIFEDLKKNFEKKVTPEELFYYIYAVLYSNTYRTKYAEFLKIDFPRIPFTKNYNFFKQLGKLGERLAELHLLKGKEIDKVISKYPTIGSDIVEKLRYEDEKVWINKEQCFNNVKEEVWNYQIGGYQVCEKWLKDRKSRTLTAEEIKTYCKIVTALSKTIELQNEIDKLYPEVEKR